MGIAVQNRRKEPRLKTAQIKKIARTICEGLDCNDSELSVLITGDLEIKELNRQWRSKNKATDVLSFSQIAPPQLNRGLHFDSIAIPEIEEIEVHSKALGDVVISADTAARQAQ